MPEQDATAEAVRWLHRSYRTGAVVDALAAVGMLHPKLYGPTLRFDERFETNRTEFTYAMRTGAPLMAGWTVLLMWADRRPLERRGVLPITVLPVIAGLMANDASMVRAGRLSSTSVAPVRALQTALVALFGYSLIKARGARPPDSSDVTRRSLRVRCTKTAHRHSQGPYGMTARDLRRSTP